MFLLWNFRWKKCLRNWLIPTKFKSLKELFMNILNLKVRINRPWKYRVNPDNIYDIMHFQINQGIIKISIQKTDLSLTYCCNQLLSKMRIQTDYILIQLIIFLAYISYYFWHTIRIKSFYLIFNLLQALFNYFFSQQRL